MTAIKPDLEAIAARLFARQLAAAYAARRDGLQPRAIHDTTHTELRREYIRLAARQARALRASVQS